MALWQDTNGHLHDDMDGEALSLSGWPAGMRKISGEEAAAIRAASQPKPDPLAQIIGMERDQLLPRVTREFMMAAFVAQAAAVNADPMTNFGYRKVKEFDDQIAALRVQL